VVVVLLWFCSVSMVKAGFSLSCGGYGPRYFFNAGASLQTTAFFSAPLSVLSSGPYLLGCTPSQATVERKNGSEYVIYAYSANGFLVSTAHWYRDGNNLGNLANVYKSYTPRYPRVIGSSQYTLGPDFINFTMEYTNSENSLLDSVSVFAPNTNSQCDKTNPIAPHTLLIESLGIMRNENENEDKENIQNGGHPEGEFTGFIAYEYQDSSVPYQATNISSNNNIQGYTDVNNQFTTNSQHYISKIQTTITSSNGKSTTTSYIYYDSNSGLATKMCQVSCIYYSYDSNGRLTSLSENGKTLESYTYTTSSGVSRISSADLGPMGKWTFSY